MPTPDVILGEKGRAGMLRGFKSIARLLAITLGPIGGNIANDRNASGEPELLKDAATVARRVIQLPDRVEDAGAMLMRHMVWRVREEVGDGSATTAVLAQAIASEVERMMAAGAIPALLRRGIERATDAAVKALEEMSVPLEGEERIAAVATAATADPAIGKLLGEMYDVLGPNANIIMEPYVATFHDRAYHDGARFKGGFVSPYLLTDQARRLAVLDDVYILIADQSFETVEGVQAIMEQVIKAGGKNLLFICKSMADKAIGVLVANNGRDVIRCCATNIKPVGDLRRGTLENIAILTGGNALTDKSGMDMKDVTLRDLGRADRVIVAKDYYMIIGGRGDKAAVRERTQKLRARLRDTYNKDDREVLRELLTQFSAGVGELRIGALTPQERTALTEVAEEAMRAVRAGMENGIVPGGGVAYLNCIPAVKAVEAEGDEAIGVQILARALEEPLRCIAANSGVHPPLAVADALRAGPGFGFDVRSKQTVDMIKAGIADPTLVTKRALQLASSGAVMLLTTEALVLHRKPKEIFIP
ncbi:MAG: chaperonin GroEL [Anaerolineae bacterium]